MKPKDCYDNTSARAKVLLRLHDGLINRRQYRIRADWASAFRRIMHWPQNHIIDRVDSADVLLILRHGSRLTRHDFVSDSLDDLLRAALTFAVSALDRYVHERVVKGVITALKAKHLTRRQEDFTVPAVVAVQIADQVARAQREKRAVRPANEVRKAIQELLHQRPFQNWRELEFAFDLIGITNLAGPLQTAYHLANIRPVRDQLNKLVEKRNRIVHEGDLVRHERGGRVRKQDISRHYVDQSLRFLDTLVANLETVR